MQPVTLSVPPNSKKNLAEDLAFLRETNPHSRIERVGENQVYIIPNTHFGMNPD